MFLKNRISKILVSIITIFNTTYLLLEIVVYCLLSIGIIAPDIRFFYTGFEGTDANIAVYDTIRGYRGVPGNSHYLAINNGKIEIDHVTKVNNHGWYSGKNYTYKKQNPKTKRYIVFGDSFSAGLVVPSSWPDVLQKMLLDSNKVDVELYNFSVDGSGIQNWHRIFLQEIVPMYEFDGIIIAPSAEKYGTPDFDRKFFMAHSVDDGTYINALDIVDTEIGDQFPMDGAIRFTRTCSLNELERVKNCYSRKSLLPLTYRYQKPDLHFLSIFMGVTDGLDRMFAFFLKSYTYNLPNEKYNKLVDQPYTLANFDNRYRYSFMLKKIISECKTSNKEVILISIPDFVNTLDYIKGQEVVYRKEYQFLSDYYQIKYYDGFETFNGKDENFVKQCFYEYDLHWNKKGVEEFSYKLTKAGKIF
jgi:hypothetical protein